MSLEEFVTRAAKVHQNKYDYSKVEYIASKEKVTITCPVHGDFEQSARGHLAGRGCRECNKNSSWSYSSWKAAGERSVLFDGFKLYVVKMWNENTKETFYKIGKTFTTVYQRFKSNGYRFEVLYTIEADAVTICELEHKYQKENSENKYSPSVQFSGHTECFTKVELKDRGLSYGC